MATTFDPAHRSPPPVPFNRATSPTALCPEPPPPSPSDALAATAKKSTEMSHAILVQETRELRAAVKALTERVERLESALVFERGMRKGIEKHVGLAVELP